jgi:hypothetical protein
MNGGNGRESCTDVPGAGSGGGVGRPRRAAPRRRPARPRVCVDVAHHAADRARGAPSAPRRRLSLRHPQQSERAGRQRAVAKPVCCSPGNARRLAPGPVPRPSRLPDARRPLRTRNLDRPHPGSTRVTVPGEAPAMAARIRAACGSMSAMRLPRTSTTARCLPGRSAAPGDCGLR